MAKVTCVAREYPSDTPFLLIDRGGYKRFQIGLEMLWFFRHPETGKVHEIHDSLVKTVGAKPVIQSLCGWSLHRTVWVRDDVQERKDGKHL